MKKLLVLGDNVHSYELLKNAQKRGVYTIISADVIKEQSPSRQVADECWDISVTDVDALVKKAKEEGVNAVICGASELCIKSVREMCKCMNTPFWIGEEAWRITNDKKIFKDLCLTCGLPVAREFMVDNELNQEDLNNVEFPVVVKPVDGCSSIGVHICNNIQDLMAGYKDAYEKSATHKVLVEKYFSGWEISLVYIFKEGRPILVGSFDVWGVKEDNNTLVFGFGTSKYLKRYEEEWKKPFERLFSELNCKTGVGFVQMVLEKENAAVMEMNYRLPGGHIKEDQLLHQHMIDCALNEDTLNIDQILQTPQARTFTYAIWLKGGKINKISGIEEIKNKLNIVSMDIQKRVGDVIEENSGMRRIFTFITCFVDLEKVEDTVKFINETLCIEDENGNDMVYKYNYY